MVPGTFGTLAGIPLFLGLSQLPGWAYMAGTLAATLVGVYLAGRAEAIYGHQDDRRIVIDEIVGYLVTMAGISPTLVSVFAGFFIFRFFDIVKPWPARSIDRRVPGGWGVVLDDVFAGLYGAGTMHLATWWWPAVIASNW